MPTELTIQAIHQGGMHFIAGDGDHTVSMDYPLQPGEKGAGMTPLRMLLSSLAVCGGSALGLLLQRMRQPLEGLTVNARGLRRDEHPTVITEISLEFVLKGAVDPAVAAKVLNQCEQQLCPVWHMLQAGTPITYSYRIVTD